MKEELYKHLEAIRKLSKARCVVVATEDSEGYVRVFRIRATAVQLIGIGEYIKGTGALLMGEKIAEHMEERAKRKDEEKTSKAPKVEEAQGEASSEQGDQGQEKV